ncbi:MAG: sodium/solute symporter [Chitinispirillaceae bacterium]|nr:sodium/solute symporter [Chitinispirillaceae bacterium]
MEFIRGYDLAVIILFLAAIPVFGLFFKKYVKSEEDYFLAGRMLPFWVIGGSIIGTNIGAYDYVGAAGGAYRFGLAQANYEWLGAIPAMILSAMLFIPFYWRSGAYTVPEYLGKRYSTAVRTIEAILWFLFLAAVLGVFFWASGIMLKGYLGWDRTLSIWIVAFIVALYTVTGGLAAVAITDVVQILVMLVGGLAVMVIGFSQTGGWTGLVAMLQPSHPNHFQLFLPLDNPDFPWLGIVLGLGLVLSPAWWCCHQAIIQRTLGAKSEWDAKASMMGAAFLKMFVPLLVVLPGLFALALCKDPSAIANPDQAFPWVMRNLLPAGLSGLVFAGFIAALLSSMDATINSTAALFTRDIYQKFMVKSAPDKHYLLVGRLVTVGLVLFGVWFAPITDRFPGIYRAMQELLTVFQGPTFAMVLLGVAWKRANRWGALVGLVGGVIVSLSLAKIWEPMMNMPRTGMNFLYVAWWSFVAALLLNVIVSLLTKPEPIEKLRGLVYGLVRDDASTQEVLKQRAEGGV